MFGERPLLVQDNDRKGDIQISKRPVGCLVYVVEPKTHVGSGRHHP